MARISELLSAFAPGGTKAEAPRPPFLAAQAESGQWSIPDLSIYANQASTYTNSGAVYFCVTRIAEAAAQVGINVLKRVGEGTEQVKNHEFELLLQRPNPHWSRTRLLEQTYAFQEIAGNSFWYLNMVGKKPVEIWPMRPDRVKPVPDPVNYVRGYVYSVDGRDIPLAPEQVVHFPRFHPLNDYVGLSAIQAAALNIQRDQAGQRWGLKFFGKDNAIPSSAVFFKQMIPDPEWERIKREWRANYGGESNAYKTAFIRGTAGEVDVRTFGLPQKDMQFLEQHASDWKDISLIFGVPLGKWSENATEANAIVADQTFWGDTMWPKLIRVTEQITSDILLPFYGQDLVAEPQDIRPKNRALEIQELATVRQGNANGQPIMTVDEIRKKYFDMPPIELEEQPALPRPRQDALPGREPTNDQNEPAPPKEPLPAEQVKSANEEGQWRRWAVKRQKDGKPLEGFIALHIAPSRRAEIREALAEATTAEEVRAAFEPSPFRRWEGYP